VLVKGDDNHGAIEPFRRAIAADPDYSKAHGMLAVALYRDGQLDSAITEANESIRLEPDNRGHYQNLAIFLEESKRPADVADVWKRYCDANPTDGIGWSQFAESLRKLDKDAEAITAYKKAAELRPTTSTSSSNSPSPSPRPASGPKPRPRPTEP
jgi:Flp pilus assembly protein TadD